MTRVSDFRSGTTELTANEARAWRRFDIRFGASLAVLSAAIFLLLLFIDPYDSGRLMHYGTLGVVDENPRTADVSRARDQAFDAAIFGNSRGQMLDPAQLSAETNFKFVQLTIPGTGPREQLSLLDWFVRHHHHIGAIIFVTDPAWCTQDAALPELNPFPFWLYSDNTINYLRNLFRTEALTRAWRRTLLWLGLRHRSRPDGYWDYEIDRTWAFQPQVSRNFSPAELAPKAPVLAFPAVAALSAAFGELPAGVALSFVMPPTFYAGLPSIGDPAADQIVQCKGALIAFAERFGGSFLDFNVDGPLARDNKNFMDTAHYRRNVANEMAIQIGAALARNAHASANSAREQGPRP